MTNTQANDKIGILAMLTRLRQLCCDPRLLFENIISPSSKLKACLDIIRSFHESHCKILLFSSYTSMLDLIAEELYELKIPYFMLTGKTSKEDRKKLIDKFQSDDTCVFLISLRN